AAKQVADRRRHRFAFASLARPGGQASHFDVIFNYIPAMEPVSLGGAPVIYTNYSGGFYLPLAVDIRETNDGLGAQLAVLFDPGLVDADDAARLARCLHFLLTNPANLSQHTIGSVPIISVAERRHLLVELNDSDMQ